MSEENKIEETEEVKDINPIDEYLNNYKEQKLAEFCVQKDKEIASRKEELHYFYEIQEGNDVADSMGIGIVPFVYDEAKKFYIDKKAVKDSVSDCDLDKMQNNKRIIKMRKPNRPDENKYKDMALIDIEKL